MKSIYLPSSQDTTINLHHDPNKDPLNLEILDVEDLYIRAADESKERSTTQWEEASRLFKKEHKINVTPTAAALLWDGIQEHLRTLKKNIQIGFAPSEKQESKSRRTAKKK